MSCEVILAVSRQLDIDPNGVVLRGEVVQWRRSDEIQAGALRDVITDCRIGGLIAMSGIGQGARSSVFHRTFFSSR